MKSATSDAIARIERDIINAVEKLDIPEVAPMFAARGYLLGVEEPAAEPKARKPRQKRGLPAQTGAAQSNGE
jgi:hypothetical protein